MPTKAELAKSLADLGVSFDENATKDQLEVLLTANSEPQAEPTPEAEPEPAPEPEETPEAPRAKKGTLLKAIHHNGVRHEAGSAAPDDLTKEQRDRLIERGCIAT